MTDSLAMFSRRSWKLWILNSPKYTSSILLVIGLGIPLDSTDQSACGKAGSTRRANSGCSAKLQESRRKCFK